MSIIHTIRPRTGFYFSETDIGSKSSSQSTSGETPQAKCQRNETTSPSERLKASVSTSTLKDEQGIRTNTGSNVGSVKKIFKSFFGKNAIMSKPVAGKNDKNNNSREIKPFSFLISDCESNSSSISFSDKEKPIVSIFQEDFDGENEVSALAENKAVGTEKNTSLDPKFKGDPTTDGTEISINDSLLEFIKFIHFNDEPVSNCANIEPNTRRSKNPLRQNGKGNERTKENFKPARFQSELPGGLVRNRPTHLAERLRIFFSESYQKNSWKDERD